MLFVQARNYRVGGNSAPTRVVIHDMEYPERLDTAESVAAWFAGPTAPVASAHYLVDADSVVQAVRDQDTAYHAPPNANSLGIEHAGYAAQSRTDWLDPYGIAMLTRSAALTRSLCLKYGIPMVKISPADLLAGKRGICGHADVSAAWHQTDHTDPGSGFPWDWYIAQVNSSPTEDSNDMADITPQQMAQIASMTADAILGRVIEQGGGTTQGVLLVAAHEAAASHAQSVALAAAVAGLASVGSDVSREDVLKVVADRVDAALANRTAVLEPVTPTP